MRTRRPVGAIPMKEPSWAPVNQVLTATRSAIATTPPPSRALARAPAVLEGADLALAGEPAGLRPGQADAAVRAPWRRGCWRAGIRGGSRIRSSARPWRRA